MGARKALPLGLIGACLVAVSLYLMFGLPVTLFAIGVAVTVCAIVFYEPKADAEHKAKMAERARQVEAGKPKW